MNRGAVKKNRKNLPHTVDIDLELWRDFQDGLSALIEVPLTLYDERGEVVAESDFARIEKLGEGIWAVERPLSFLGVPLGTRMTVMLDAGELVLHSPVSPDPELVAELEELGPVVWTAAPNKFHHL